ncbi:agmatinase [Agaricicola taiwanensis]|uniref:Agmatinase n=1 Tax=Agaricicola taiwanensis TaxID=591372 RepID=A0A8J2YJ19_9RHOB|nr:agmatinase [Agaricicola taiwanensis]GGE45907.1 agmatinase [Agaricicola taiwanensis]
MNDDPAHPRPVDRALDLEFRYGQSTEPNYSGAVSFLRRPYRSASDADVAVWGVPLDVAVSNRPGTRFGPRAIREASTILDGDPIYPFGVDAFAEMAVVDTGDAAFDHGRPEEIPAAIEAQARERLRSGTQLVTLGGDHFITYPILRALVARLGTPIALIHFDAHQDTWPDDGDRIDHGTFVRRVVREGLIIPERSIQIGIRTHAPEDLGIARVDGFEFDELGALAAASRILGHVKDAPAYITFDIDALDPAFAPGTGTPVCGGLSTREAQACLMSLGSLDLKGFDIVEVSPPYDHAGITSLAGAMLAQTYLSLLAARKANGQSIAV